MGSALVDELELWFGSQITSDELGEPICLLLHASGLASLFLSSVPEPPVPSCCGEVTELGMPCSVLGWPGTSVPWSCVLMPVLDWRGVVVDGVDDGKPPVDWPAPPVPISVPGVPGCGAVGEIGSFAAGVVTSVA